jgi:hypothetical protein
MRADYAPAAGQAQTLAIYAFGCEEELEHSLQRLLVHVLTRVA